MRIAEVAPLWKSVPPRRYGGTERVIAWLVDELVEMGHDVTLFASGDSQTRARLVAGHPCELGFEARFPARVATHLLMIERALAGGFDIVHFHTDLLHYPAASRAAVPSVATLHGRLDAAFVGEVLREFAGVPLVSISDAQRAPVPWARFAATVHHGLPLRRRALASPDEGRFGPPGYLAFLGRLNPDKGVEQALAIARLARLPLCVAGNVDIDGRAYFEERLRPTFEAGRGVRYAGEISEAEKAPFFAGARALLFPIEWPEPFGLVMIEAMSCGVPVIAFRAGSVPEVVDEGRTGFVVEGIEEAAAAVPRALALSRAEVLAVFERRFSARRMAEEYVEVFERVVREKGRGEARRPRAG